jgi:hypothetical protein
VKRTIGSKLFSLGMVVLCTWMGAAPARAESSASAPLHEAGPTLGGPGVPGIRQFKSAVLGLNNFASSYSVQFDKPTLPGSAIWVVVTSPDHDYPTPFVFQVSDTQNNGYKFVGQANDFNNGIQSVAHFIAFSTKGDSADCGCTQIGETVTFNLLENGATANDNYLGIFVVEVVGLDSTKYSHSENINADPAQGANLVSSGPIPASSPALVLAVSENTDGGASDTGGSGSGGPAAGSDMCQQGALFFAFDEFTPLATFATGVVKPTAGSVTAYFDAAAEPGASVVNKNEYVTVAIAFPLERWY